MRKRSGEMAEGTQNGVWTALNRKLALWLRLYLVTCLVSFACMFFPTSFIAVLTFQIAGLLTLVIAVVAFVYAYRVLAALNRAGMSRTGSWTIIVTPFIIGPLFQNFGSTNGEWILFWLAIAIMPVFVLMHANRISRRVTAETTAPPPETPSSVS